MTFRVPKPLIGIPVSIYQIPDYKVGIHGAGEKYILAAADGAEGTPFLIPALGERIGIADVVAKIDGLMLTGGRANVEPHHYGGPPFPEDEIRDPARDSTVLPLIRACIDSGVPVFGVCRGIQEMNVALGGSLHYRVHLMPGKVDHRMGEGDTEHRFRLKHTLHLAPGGLLARLAGTTEVKVNSLHGQGIDRLADGLVAEAVAPDGLIEAVRLEGATTFTVGVQWHAEWRFAEPPLSKALFAAFGTACRARAEVRTGPRSVSRGGDEAALEGRAPRRLNVAGGPRR